MQQNILIIQTAFIGDSILALALVEETKRRFPKANIHFLLRKGNESIAINNPQIEKLWIWDKSGWKYINLLKLTLKMRAFKFEFVFNIHRHASSGMVTALMKAKSKIGFDKNPLSFLFSKKIQHKIPHYNLDGSYLHEVQRNFLLLNEVLGKNIEIPKKEDLLPKLYFSQNEIDKVMPLKHMPYVIIVPASVWFTKQWAKEKWIELVNQMPSDLRIYLVGAPAEKDFCNEIMGDHNNAINLCGKLSLAESAFLMDGAFRVFVNDSAALHLATAVQAPVTAIFNSTVPEFGYGIIGSKSKLIQLSPRLDCMPCGLHGHKACPKSHYNCAMKIETVTVLKTLES
jgi:ADP-heptose:LPS heptosyltransferase